MPITNGDINRFDLQLESGKLNEYWMETHDSYSLKNTFINRKSVNPERKQYDRVCHAEQPERLHSISHCWAAASRSPVHHQAHSFPQIKALC